MDQLDFEFVLFASAVIDYDYIMGLIAKMTQAPAGKRTMNREQLIGIIQADAKFIDERDDIAEYPTQISSLKLALPSMEEQGRIADTIFAVERVIVAQRNRLIDLKSHKSGLLQQFFPSTAEVIA